MYIYDKYHSIRGTNGIQVIQPLGVYMLFVTSSHCQHDSITAVRSPCLPPCSIACLLAYLLAYLPAPMHHVCTWL